MAGAAFGAIASVGRSYNALLKQYGRKLSRVRTQRAARDRYDQPCHWLCLDCGHLVPQRAVDYRTSPENLDDARPRCCSACGGSSHVDLRDDAVVESLRSREEDDERRRVRTQRRLRVGVFAGVLALTYLLSGSIRLGLALAVFFHVVLVRHLQLRLPTPARWLMPSEPEGAVTDATMGVARVEGHLLVSPLTGRPCVAYEVGIRSDDRLTGDTNSWRLLEQRSAALRVGTTSVPADALALRLQRNRVPVGPERVATFLRRRGLDRVEASDWIFTETIVAPEESVWLTTHESGHTLRRAAELPAAERRFLPAA